MFARGARPSSGGRYKFGERSSETLKRKDKYLTIDDKSSWPHFCVRRSRLRETPPRFNKKNSHPKPARQQGKDCFATQLLLKCIQRSGRKRTDRRTDGVQTKEGDLRMSTKCRHCGSTSYGSGCVHSPTRKHEHRDDEKHCEWCGSSSYGSGCIHSPTRKHRHGPGANKCVWCGSTSTGSGCVHSPTGRHEK